jgi:hypothetical protein
VNNRTVPWIFPLRPFNSLPAGQQLDEARKGWRCFIPEREQAEGMKKLVGMLRFFEKVY